MKRPVTVRAPGKLMIAGEYAVLTPGQPAVVAAVDRYISVTATHCVGAAHDVELVSDLLPQPVALLRDTTGLHAVDEGDNAHLKGPLELLLTVVRTVDDLLAELGRPPVRARLEIRSALHEHGVKIGLGSSGAVTAAAVQALTDYAGLPLTAETRFRLALLAGITLDPAPSGADVAASIWQGWITYSPPDRAALLGHLSHHGILDTLHAPWSGLSIRALPPPVSLTLQAGWTSRPASTSDKVGLLRAHPWWASTGHYAFRHRSARVVADIGRALEKDEPALLLGAVTRAHALIARLDEETGLGVFTPELATLCRTAYDAGGVAKPSGAGGGDCGIAFVPSTSSVKELHRHWTQVGITPLSLTTATVPDGQVPVDAGPRLRGPLSRVLGAPIVRTLL
ncbi:phosphomevalonate kinase [Streptomyces sp. NPDC001941]|uniref:phosphomevalonate kinase n=1 Tax=Streptomyces sp. NPDC001941 TaxID=3154659 RepID=UPI00332EE074